MSRSIDPGNRRSPTKEIEFEVLPQEEKSRRLQLEPLFRGLALIMDNLLRMPGTKLRFGLDPLIGLVPGIGDSASAIVSALALIYAARRGLPKVALLRMSVNILINEFVGIIPGLGDAFSFWFKSNARNYRIVQLYLDAPQRARRSDWIFVIVVLTFLSIIVCAGVLVSFFVLNQLLKLLRGQVIL